jgi:hypothetical protein
LLNTDSFRFTAFLGLHSDFKSHLDIVFAVRVQL